VINCAIYLGGGRKKELFISSPVLVASGALGYGQFDVEALRRGQIGALVTPPLTWKPRSEASQPRLARTVAGYVIHTGRRNPGLRATVRRYSRLWEGAGVPIIAAIYGQTSDDFAEMAAFLTTAECVQGIELHLPHRMEEEQARRCVEAALAEVAMPCMVRVPFEQAMSFALASAEAGADALVVAAPPLGRALSDNSTWIYGPLHSPALAPIYAQLVYEIAAATEIPVIGRGGIAEPRHALALIAAGAVAIQVDSILLMNPNACADLYLGLEREMARLGLSTWEEMLGQQRLSAH